MINTDIFLRQGSTHKICEDYVLTKDGQIVLTDGCSAAVHADFGARLLAAATLGYSRKRFSEDRWDRIITNADVCRKSIGLPSQSLCATILTAEIVDSEIVVDIVGDGVVVGRQKENGIFKVFNFSYPSGAPYYLKYNLSKEDQQQWIQEFGFRHIITSFQWHPDWTEPKIEMQSESLDEIVVNTLKFSTDIYDLVVLFSDGVQTFSALTEKGVARKISMFDVFKQILSFKSTRGEFVHKRCVKAFRQFAKDGWIHTDDFSIVAISVGE